MKKFRKENNVGKKLLIFAIASFMWSSTISMISVTPVVSVTSGAPEPVVDGVISPGEYDDGLYIPLTGPWPPEAPFPPSLVDGYLYWNTTHLWIAVDEPFPNWGGGPRDNFVEFMWDPGPADPYLRAWVLWDDGWWSHVRCPKWGCWGTTGDPFPGNSSWAVGSACEFVFDYTDYGTSYGDTIKLIVDTSEDAHLYPPFGDCQVWPANPTYYPCENPSSVPTWGTITLGGNQPPVADAGGPYSGMVGESILLDGSGSSDLDGTIVSYEWDLDDDGFYDDATGVTTTNSWSSDGTYPISLKVTDDGGLFDTDDTTVNIGDHVVDGIISPDEYDGGMAVQLVDDVDPGVTYDALIDWDDQYLYVAVDEPVPNYIEFAFDAGAHRDYWDVFTLFASGSTSHQKCLKPDGAWTGDPYDFEALSDTATEFKVDYTDFGIAFGDTIKMCIERGDPTAFWPEGGIIWQNPPRTPDPATWGTIVLNGNGNQPPTADAGGPYSGMVGESILLDGSGSSDLDGTIVSYEWDLDDDGFYDDATGSTTTNSWSSDGTYPISLKVTDDGGLSDTDDTTVNIGDHVVDGVISPGEYDDAMYVPLTGPWPPEAPFPPSLVDCYIYWDTQYLWIAVDEPVPNWGTASGDNFIEFMWDPGPADPYLRAWVLWDNGWWSHVRCPKWGCWGGTADPFPGTSWWAVDTATEFKFDYTLYGTSYGDTIKLIVDTAEDAHLYPPFGDCQVWPANPTYYPCETASTVLTWGDVTLGPPPDIPPVADANGPYEDDNCDYTIDLDGSVSYDPDGSIVSYDWDFGDGTGYHNDIGATPSYTYPSFGEYTVTLRVTDNDALTDTDTSTAKVYGVNADAGGPYEDTDYDDDYTIDFDGSGSTGYQTPLIYDWDFGDGTGWHNDIGATPSNTYPSFGVYTVTLRVTESGNGCSDMDTTTAKILHLPPVANANGPYEGVVGIPIDFTGSASGTQPYSWHWEFGDGDTSTLQNPTHPYDTLGEYTATLTVTDAYGMTDDDTAQVSIGGHPPNKPTIDGSNSGKPGTEYEYTFNAIDPDGDNVKYHINWGDTNSETTAFSFSGTDVKVKHTWSTGGTYTIKATAEDSNGLVGPEGTLSVSMPRNRATLFLQFLQNFLQNHPLLYQVLQRVLRL